MTKEDIRKIIYEIFADEELNYVKNTDPVSERYEGLKIYEEPLIGFAAADDPLFDLYKDPKVIGPWHMTPKEWLDDAATVISIFFPFTEEVKAPERRKEAAPTPQWLLGRIEGENCMIAVAEKLKKRLEENGTACCVPSHDPRWGVLAAGQGTISGYPEINERTFGSRWSERHAAYACGLGTFGLSKCFITKKGTAGRLKSIIISEKLEPDIRPYTGIYDNCLMCGECARRCPEHAITLENGKDHIPCGRRISESKILYAPRYGCGKCQTAVPCESRIPKKPGA